jgi:hypothetical protein
MFGANRAVLICSDMVLISTQDLCMVRGEHAIDSEIVLGALDGIPT